MELITTIDTDIKQAMLSKDAARLRGLRSIKAALMLARTEEGAGGTVSPEAELKVLQKLAKQRRESSEIYREQDRPDLEKTELEELEVIEEYLPRQIPQDELESVLQAIISETGASSMKDMGKVMGKASQQLAGRADGKAISETVRRLLS
ncbi:MAG TPA: GatB/YqeY domain-containing protein [Anseongella sp.]